MSDDADLRELQALKLRKAKLKQLLKRLTCHPGSELTQDEVAFLHGTTRHDIRQVERRALLKARRKSDQLLTPTNQP
jgi:transcriptional regulator